MLTIVPRGNRALLRGNIAPALEEDLQRRFSWRSAVDLNDVICFYADRVMYSGVVEEVSQYIRERGVECEIEYPELPTQRYDWRLKRSYRPLQEDAVNALYSSRFGLLRSPPGTGKTTMMAGLFCKVGLPGFVVTPQERPFTQAYNTFKEHTTIHHVGRWNGEHKELASDGVTIITVQSLTSELINNPNGPLAQAWAKAKVVAIDEAHHAASDTHINAFDLLANVYYFLGVSATPWRDDDRGEWLEAVLGKIVHQITRADAVANRLSVPLTVFVEDMPAKEYGYVVRGKNVTADAPRRRGQKSPFEKVYDDYIVHNDHRNRRGIEFCLEAIRDAQLSCCISVRYIDHIKALQEICPLITSLHGKTKHREDVFEAMQKKETMFVASTLMDEAVDVSSLSCVAMLAGGKSTIKLEQRIRCDRVFEGMTVHGYFAKDRGYVFMPRDTADFLTSHATSNVKLLKDICDEHEDHEFYLNGVLVPRYRRVPQRRRDNDEGTAKAA